MAPDPARRAHSIPPGGAWPQDGTGKLERNVVGNEVMEKGW